MASPEHRVVPDLSSIPDGAPACDASKPAQAHAPPSGPPTHAYSYALDIDELARPCEQTECEDQTVTTPPVVVESGESHDEEA
jgi:hypothetical protein